MAEQPGRRVENAGMPMGRLEVAGVLLALAYTQTARLKKIAQVL